jgi:hypothetical protein
MLSITTSGGVLTVTELTGGNNTLTLTQPSEGTLQFTASGRPAAPTACNTQRVPARPTPGWISAPKGASVTETYGPFTPGTLIADADPSLSAFLVSINSSTILSLSEVTIQFELRGTPVGTGFASDMLASLIRTPRGPPSRTPTPPPSGSTVRASRISTPSGLPMTDGT